MPNAHTTFNGLTVEHRPIKCMSFSSEKKNCPAVST